MRGRLLRLSLLAPVVALGGALVALAAHCHGLLHAAVAGERPQVGPATWAVVGGFAPPPQLAGIDVAQRSGACLRRAAHPRQACSVPAAPAAPAAVRMPRRASSARSCSTSGLPVVRSFSP